MSPSFWVAWWVFVVCVWIPLTNWAPTSVLSAGARVLRLFKKPKRFDATPIEDGVVLGSLPSSGEHLKHLREECGVGAVLTLNEDWELKLSRTDFETHGMAWKRIAVPDYCAPSTAQIVEAVEFIQTQRQAGHGVYVHCNGGKGRSAICVMGWLMRNKRWNADDAYDFVSSKRKIANIRSFGGLRPQWRAVRRYERFLRLQPRPR